MAYTLATYRRESVLGFEVRQTLLRRTVVTDGIREGATYTFLVSDADGQEATTRGVAGDIIYGTHNRDQYTVTMKERHGTDSKTGFNIFQSQGDTAKAMQDGCFAKINRAIDGDLIDTLETATTSIGTAVPAAFLTIQKAMTRLQNAKVPWDRNITLLVTPAFHGYMLGWNEFKNAMEVNAKPMENGGAAWTDQPVFYNWMNMNVIVHPSLPGVGTASETCFLYHKNSVGSAFAMDQEKIMAGYDEKQDSSWSRMSAYIGSALLQDAGVIKIPHDGSALSA